MPTPQRTVIFDTAEASARGRIHFGEVVMRLAEAGVESYHVDYRAGRSTYYLPGGDTVDVDTGHAGTPVADQFDTAGIVAAIRGAQAGTVMYPEFKRLSQAAGCASYTVWIAGRQVDHRSGMKLPSNSPGIKRAIGLAIGAALAERRKEQGMTQG